MPTTIDTKLEKIPDQQAYLLLLNMNPESGKTLVSDGPPAGTLRRGDPSTREIKFRFADGNGSRIEKQILLDTFDIGTEKTVLIELLDDRGNPIAYDRVGGGGLEHYDDADGGGED